MNQYYLIAQLPSLDFLSDTAPLPITEERFHELCSRFLGKKALEELNRLSLMPPREPKKSSSAVIRAWNEGERSLRLNLAKVRAEKLKKSFDGKADEDDKLIQVAKTAISYTDPLEAEKYLNGYRMGFLESLKPADGFSEDSLYLYALKLKLLNRIRAFDEAKGEAAYKNIYDSIINGDRPEVTQ